MVKYLFTTDLHYGFERKNGHKVPLHDVKAWNAVLAFARDFKPDVWILGGDMLDVGCVSHHNHGKPGATEGLKLIADAREGRKMFIEPVQEIVGKKGKLVYIRGNHERFLDDLTEKIPGLEGLLDLDQLLKLDKQWEIVPQGGAYKLGKVTFVHGDTISGGENAAKGSVTTYERNIRFGHIHTYAAYTKTSPLDAKLAKTGIAVPCLCGKVPNYGRGKPNRWTQGYLYGYIDTDGTFNDYVVIITDGKCIVNGKAYKG